MPPQQTHHVGPMLVLTFYHWAITMPTMGQPIVFTGSTSNMCFAQIHDYVCGDGGDVPLLILGQPGMGKSSIMAKAADDTNTLALDRKIPG